MATEDIKVPDIGDFDKVPVIEIHVAEGDVVSAEDPLVTLESDKAAMDVPAPKGGKVTALKVSVGDEVGEGSVILSIEVEGGEASGGGGDDAPKDEPAKESKPAAAPSGSKGKGDVHGQLVVLGSGPGGYSAAFRAADLGMDVVLIERWDVLGGVCLNVGCIPSKALLHSAKVMSEADEMGEHGISFAKPKVDLDKLRGWKDGIIEKLVGGLSGLAKQRKVKVVHGVGTFSGPNEITVEKDGKTTTVSFDQAIIAAGSEAVHLPFIPHDDPRVMDSTGALELEEIPKKMLVIGGGIIGLEMATVYQSLGAEISIVEVMDELMAGADKDLVKPWRKINEPKYKEIMLQTKVTDVKAQKNALKVTFEDKDGESFSKQYDRILVSVGRTPNGKKINAEAAGVEVSDRGFIATDKAMRTNVGHIFAIGDIVGQPMLAHKAVHEGKVAAEACAGHKSAFDAKVIPSVAYTDPEVAWVGVTETEAKKNGTKFEKGSFPWAASGRSLANGRSEGVTKVLFDPDTHRIIGAGIVGTSAGDLIAEAALAIEMGADAQDIALTIHPHPTLSETVAFATEMFDGTITDLMPPKKKR